MAITFPAIGLPDVLYSSMRKLRGVDLIASNDNSSKVLIGKAARAQDLNAVKVTLFHNGQKVSGGVGSHAGDDQWKALQWVVNDVLAKGGEVKNGYINFVISHIFSILLLFIFAVLCMCHSDGPSGAKPLPWEFIYGTG